MPAVNGVKKSSVSKQKGKVGVIVPVMTAIISILITVLGVAVFWKFYYEQTYRDQVLLSIEKDEYKAYVAIRDISPGEYIDGAVQEINIPTSMATSDMVNVGDNLSKLKASHGISANSMITNKNCYDPEMQNPILEGTRTYMISYLSTPGITEGDFIDIRLKKYVGNDETTYKDYVVCSKIEILAKEQSGSIRINLSKADLLNLNSAVIEAADTENGKRAEIYVCKYVDPANQKKVEVDYNGAGKVYTQQELLEAQDKVQNGTNNGGVFDNVNNNIDNNADSNNSIDNTGMDNTGDVTGDTGIDNQGNEGQQPIDDGTLNP